jgi:undecaprenyl-diphosphatase
MLRPFGMAPIRSKGAGAGRQSKVAGAIANLRRYEGALFQTYMVGAALGFGALTLIAHRKPYFDADLKICRALQRVQYPGYTRLMNAVSWPGYPPQATVLGALLPIAMYRRGLKWEAVATTLSTAGMAVAGLMVKLIVDRPRPHPDLVRVQRALNGGKQSFPAGHVQTYVPLFGFLAFISYNVIQHSWQRTLTLWISLTSIALVGPSRIHAGEHWPSDVLGGYFLGSLWLWLTVQVYRLGKPWFFVRDQRGSPVRRSLYSAIVYGRLAPGRWRRSHDDRQRERMHH